MKIICDVTRCGHNTAKLISERTGECKCDCIELSHFCHSMQDEKNVVDCKSYYNGYKPFGEYNEED